MASTSFLRAALLFIAALHVSASSSAQIGVDVSGAGGSAVTAALGDGLISDATAIGVASVALDPGWPRGIRLAASAMYGAGDVRANGRMASFGVGAEAPLSGGRNGVYMAIGAALVDFDNPDVDRCRFEAGCLNESAALPSHAGLTATVGLGARIPVVRRVWIEPSVSAFVWGDVLPRGQVAVGWRLR